jgi:hypothetical protein
MVSRLLKTIKIRGPRRGMHSDYGLMGLTQCNLIDIYQRLEGSCSLHFQVQKMQYSTWSGQLFIPFCPSMHIFLNIPAQPPTFCISLPLAINEEPIYSSEKSVYPLDEYVTS